MNEQFNRNKQFAGLIYGLAAAFAFVVLAWGVDALALARAHAMFAWAKVIPGLLICLPVGAMVGWVTMRTENHFFALLLWMLIAVLFAWLVIWLPLKNTLNVVRIFDAELFNLMKYPRLNMQWQFVLVAFAVIALVAIITGLLEINLVSQAMLSSARAAFITPIILCVIMFGVAGGAVDSILNKNMREPVAAMDNLIQFAVENRGREVDPMLARQMRLNAVKPLGELLTRDHRMILGSFDNNLSSLHVMIDFDGLWADCTVIYNQPTFCERMHYLPGEADFRYTDQVKNLAWQN